MTQQIDVEKLQGMARQRLFRERAESCEQHAANMGDMAGWEETEHTRSLEAQAWREHFDRRRQAFYRQMVHARNAAAWWRAQARAVKS